MVTVVHEPPMWPRPLQRSPTFDSSHADAAAPAPPGVAQAPLAGAGTQTYVRRASADSGGTTSALARPTVTWHERPSGTASGPGATSISFQCTQKRVSSSTTTF